MTGTAAAARTAAPPSAELRVAFLPTERGVALTVHGLVDGTTFPVLRAALLTAAAGLEALTVDLRQATVHGDDCRLLLAALERRMRRFGRRLEVVGAVTPPPPGAGDRALR